MNKITKYELLDFASIIIFMAAILFLQTDIIVAERKGKTFVGIISLFLYLILIILRDKEAKKLPSDFSHNRFLKIASFILTAAFIAVEIVILQKSCFPMHAEQMQKSCYRFSHKYKTFIKCFLIYTIAL